MPKNSDPSILQPNAIERVYRYLWGLFKLVFITTLFLFVGVILSIIIEWIGMNFFWEDEGSLHAKNMLATEMQYLDADFSRQVAGISPSVLASKVAQNTKSRLDSNRRWRNLVYNLSLPVYQTDNVAVEYGKRIIRASEPYRSSAYDIMILYSVRVAVILMSLPLIALVTYAWVVDGLCQRELRKDGGGRESTSRFHLFAKYADIFLLAPFIFYLASPVATHPNWVLVPITIGVASLSYFGVSNYKKYW